MFQRSPAQWVREWDLVSLMGLMTLTNAFGPGLFGILADFTNLRMAILWYITSHIRWLLTYHGPIYEKTNR